jgi:hypothetical protein
MSTTTNTRTLTAPRWTVWAYTDAGDCPRSTDDLADLAVLVEEATRSRGVGIVTITEYGEEVASGCWTRTTEYLELDEYVNEVREERANAS